MAWIMYDPNPVRSDGVGDCSIRAVSKALDTTWEKAFSLLATNAYLMGDVPSSDVVWGSVLRQHGFTRHVMPNECPDCYTVERFAAEHPTGTYVVKSEGHVATIYNGNLYDSWPSENKIVIYYWTNSEDGAKTK